MTQQDQQDCIVDHDPATVVGTVAQPHVVEVFDHPVWRPVTHTTRAKTTAKFNYGKVDDQSLSILSGIHNNKMYLYGKKFTVAVDHKPLVVLYNSHSLKLPFRVAKCKIKIR